MISCYYFLYLYMVFLTLFSHCFHTFLQNNFQCSFHNYKLKFIIINSYEHFKFIELNPQLNIVESFITHCSSDSSMSYHPYCTSVMSIVKSYNSISLSRFKSISPTILGSNVCQLQTSLTLHCLVKISLLTVSYKLHYSVNVANVFGVLIIIGHIDS